MAPHLGHLTLVSLATPAHPKEKKAKSTKAKNKLTIFIQFFILGTPFLRITPTTDNIIIEIDLFNLISKVTSEITSSSSKWFFGPYGFVSKNPVEFKKPIPCESKLLGIFDVPEKVIRKTK